MKSDNAEMIIYRTADGKVKIDCRLDGETLWLTQAQMAQLFGRDKSVITKHIRNIFTEGELAEKTTCAKFAQVQIEGEREVTREVECYNLDVILAVSYRVKSVCGTQFRQWATRILHEYLQKGFSMNDEVLKNMGGGLYWKELTELKPWTSFVAILTWAFWRSEE